MCDDRPDTTFLGNWRFWLVLFLCACLWGVIIWAAVTA
jgi:hypothetical protein